MDKKGNLGDLKNLDKPYPACNEGFFQTLNKAILEAIADAEVAVDAKDAPVVQAVAAAVEVRILWILRGPAA